MIAAGNSIDSNSAAITMKIIISAISVLKAICCPASSSWSKLWPKLQA
jgi:hypothetical protein